MASKEALHVVWVTGCNDRGIKGKRSGRYESIHRMFGGHSRFCQEAAGSLCDGPSQVHYADTSVIEKVINGSIEPRTATDFS
jgi:hypothetical protein